MGKDAQVGRPKYKNVSVVDYVICTPSLFLTIANFEVEDFNPMLSDVHSARRLTLRREAHCDPDTHHATPPPKLNQHNSLPLELRWKRELGQYEQTLKLHNCFVYFIQKINPWRMVFYFFILLPRLLSY